MDWKLGVPSKPVLAPCVDGAKIPADYSVDSACGDMEIYQEEIERCVKYLDFQWRNQLANKTGISAMEIEWRKESAAVAVLTIIRERGGVVE